MASLYHHEPLAMVPCSQSVSGASHLPVLILKEGVAPIILVLAPLELLRSVSLITEARVLATGTSLCSSMSVLEGEVDTLFR